MQTFCLTVCPQGGSGLSNAIDSNARPQDMQMSDNLIYFSREEGKGTEHKTVGS